MRGFWSISLAPRGLVGDNNARLTPDLSDSSLMIFLRRMPSLVKLRLAAIMALCLLAGAGALPANQSSARAQSGAAAMEIDPDVSPALAEALQSGLKAGRAGAARFRDIEGLRDFYRERGFKPLWLTRRDAFNETAKTVLGALEVSWTHGLNPLTYHVDTLRTALEGTGRLTPADFELLMSDAVVRYGRDLTGMRVTPGSVGQSAAYWQPPMRGGDILRWMARNPDKTRWALGQLAPQGDLYQKLREQLIKTLAEPEEESRPAVRISGNLRPGSHHDAVPTIRRFLKAGSAPPQGATYYDAALAEAVKQFQAAHGFAADAIIGPATQKILNLSRLDKINQLVVNLERQRWMDRVRPDKYVMVNIPSATLWAVENGRTQLQMKVIVGKETRPTNSFKTTITGVRFNPTWTVPPTIKKEDYLPALAEDPEYLAKRGIEIMYDGKTVDPVTVNWAELPWEQAKNLTMRQGPGGANPLGRIRILMPNNYNIYLHDTNDRSVFTRNTRTLSSGCIRIEEPEKLADFILADNQGWSDETRRAVLASEAMRDIGAQTPIPVYLVYNTIWEKGDGGVVYGYDLYGSDDQLMGAIRAIDGFKAPDNIAQIIAGRHFKAKTGLDY